MKKKMSTLETQPDFRKQTEETTVPTYLNGSGEFILISDHQTSKQKSLEQLESLEDSSSCKSCFGKFFSKKTLCKRLPILQWLPHYTREDAIGDLIAGFTVGLTVIPQGLAYSGIAGLPTQYGLYGSFIGCFMYVLLGTCKDSTIGSTSVASLLVFQFAQGVWQRAVLLTFLTGIIELIMAVFQLGFLVEFVSGPVSAGFTSAVALIISTSQIKNILGVRNDGTTFLQRWITIFKNIETIHVADACLGFGCVFVLISLRYVGRIKIGLKNPNGPGRCQKMMNRIFWFMGVTRNATVVIVCAGVSMYLHNQGKRYFRLTGYVPAGLPTPSFPPFSIEAVPGNVTAGIEAVPAESFSEMIEHLGYGLVIVPLIALLENIAVCKAFVKGQPIDATQELIAIGVANIGNSFFSGYRANGGLARSAVNNASGVRTQMANLHIGLVVVLALMYLAEYFYFIPKAVLASVIISAVIFQLQYQVIVPMWRSKRSDLVPCFVAFIACLVMPLEVGIIIAIGVNLLFILYYSARPKVSLETLETSNGLKFLKLTPDRCLIFPSVEFVRNLVLKSGIKTTLPVVIDCTYIYGADFTAAYVIKSMVEDFNKRNQIIIFFNLKPSVVNIFEGLHTKLVICYNIHSLEQELSKGEINEDVSNVTIDNPVGPKAIEDDVGCEVASNASTLTLTKL